LLPHPELLWITAFAGMTMTRMKAQPNSLVVSSMNLDAFPRIPLFDAPTPIQRLERIEAALGLRGVRLFVKRDDLMGLGGGGNKLRKLEFLLGAAIDQGCDTFVTTGARQSNHARLSAAAAARMGLAAELMLTDTVPREDDSYRHNGNQLLDGLFGARVHHLPRGADALAAAHAREAALRAEGRKAYVVGAGGSSPVGALGYASCAEEIRAQEVALGLSFGTIIVANGSHGTHARPAARAFLPRARRAGGSRAGHAGAGQRDAQPAGAPHAERRGYPDRRLPARRGLWHPDRGDAGRRPADGADGRVADRPGL